MNRIRSIDLARGFTVTFIPAIHTGMLYSRLAVHKSLLGLFLIAVAEGPGGQLLMLLMGISFALKETHSLRSVFIRSVTLLITGFLLNVLKFVIPHALGALPRDVLGALGISTGDNVCTRLAGIGDILHFAALAQWVLFGLSRIKNHQWWALAVAAIIAVAGPLVWDRQPEVPFFNYLAGLATGHPPKVFFPLFPWLVYPLVGLSLGYFINDQRSQIMKYCGATGLILLSGGLISQLLFPILNPDGFYRTPLSGTCWHLGIVLVWLYGWHLIAHRYKSNLIFEVLEYSGRHITLIYFIQWVIICWLLPFLGFRTLDLLHSSLVMIIITADTYILTYIVNRIKQYYAKNKSI